MRMEFLDLPVWDDNELTDVLGEKPKCRAKLHHWPLSYVERVDLSEKSVVVVKYAKLSTENAFYLSASASFLVKPIIMTEIGDTSIIVLPFVHGREPEMHEIASAVEMIPQISCDTLWADASTHTRFMDLMRDAGDILEKHDPSASAAAFLEKCASFEPFFADGCTGFVHGDLKKDNIIVHGDKTIILDWQRPMKAPLIIDKVTCGLETDENAAALAKAFESYWLLYAFDRCLYKLPHVLGWAKKSISDMLG